MTTTLAFSLRIALPEDAERVTAMLWASYPVLLATDYNADFLARALPLMCRANPSLLASGTYYVAEVAGDIVGCGGWTKEQPGSGAIVPAEGHIRHLGTHPVAARCGVASGIVRRCFADARKSGIRTLHVIATRTAVPFYQSLDFKMVGAIEVPLADDLSLQSVLMRTGIE
jgi:N-acetylglutamate synthase-like GNAT family acetyltransferase